MRYLFKYKFITALMLVSITVNAADRTFCSIQDGIEKCLKIDMPNPYDEKELFVSIKKSPQKSLLNIPEIKYGKVSSISKMKTNKVTNSEGNQAYSIQNELVAKNTETSNTVESLEFKKYIDTLVLSKI